MQLFVAGTADAVAAATDDATEVAVDDVAALEDVAVTGKHTADGCDVLDDGATDATTANDIFGIDGDTVDVERTEGADDSSMHADDTISDTEICTADAAIAAANGW